MCWKDMPERAEQAAQALVRIYTERGDAENAKRFAEMTGGRKAAAAAADFLQALPHSAVSPESLPPPPSQPAASAAEQIDLTSEFSLALVEEAEAAPTPPVSSTASAGVTFELSRPPEQEAPAATLAQIPFDLSAAPRVASPTTSALGISLDSSILPAPKAPPPAPLELPIEVAPLPSSVPPPAPPSEIQEIDLSEDWEVFQAETAKASPARETPQEVASFNYDDSRIEVSFYLEHGFVEEARRAVEELERTLPSDPRIAELRALVEAHTGVLAGEVPEKQPGETLRPTHLEAVAPPAEKAVERWELSSSYAVPEPKAQPAAAMPISPTGEEIPTEATFGATIEATTNLLGDLADAFGSAMGGLEEPSPLLAPPSAPTAGRASKSAAPTPALASPLSGLLEEIGEAPGMGPVREDDAETHYNLGVAFREMNLLDEAIGEFQKVVKGAGKRPHPPNYLQACTLLAACFMDKGMASIAVKWYCRALETPELDEEAVLALQYDLAVAYEQAGDLPRALEKFTEVYGQNIDFRDVAEKIRTFQQKRS
jgi:tetratricopeptide (TPR) repeat protein